MRALVVEPLESAVAVLLTGAGFEVERLALDQAATRLRTQAYPLIVADPSGIEPLAPLSAGTLIAIVDDDVQLDQALRHGASDAVVLPRDQQRFRARVERAAAAAPTSDEQRRIEAEHLALVERSADGVFTHRADLTVAYVNPAFVAFLGYSSAAELLDRPVLDLVHPEDRPMIQGRIRQVFDSQQPTRPRPVRFLARDGSTLWAETRGSFVASGLATVTARDLTERRQSENALRLSEQRFATIFRASPVASSIGRLSDGKILDVNERFLALTGYTREQVVGKSSAELKLWQSPSLRSELYQEVQAGRSVRDHEVAVQRANGEPLVVLLSLEPVEVGDERCVLVMGHDITARKQLEEQLHQSQKMEAVGRLAGGVAHDFNNILTTIRGYGDLVLEQLTPSSPAYDGVQRIRRAATRAAGLTEQLLVFTRRRPPQPKLVRLNDVVQQMYGLLKRIIGEDIRLELRLQRDVSRARVDPGQMEQMILNLAINGRDAMASGGRLLIETANHSDTMVRLTVEDDGCGMDDETRRHIFEPFFTTKEAGKGTGLGLSIVHAIVEQSAGSITVESAPSRGACFHIFLPRVDDSEPTPERVTPLPLTPTPAGNETILVAEDDEEVRDFVEHVLRRAGYHVLAASDGAVALRLAQGFPGEIELLLSDIVMPNVNGRQLAEQLQPLRPRLRVLHMSGYPGDTIARYGDVREAGAFLQKPFSARELAERVREILDGSAQ